jgi:hypothetical protein
MIGNPILFRKKAETAFPSFHSSFHPLNNWFRTEQERGHRSSSRLCRGLATCAHEISANKLAKPWKAFAKPGKAKWRFRPLVF